jgi:hypothetical protein
MITFGDMVIIDIHSDKKIRNKIVDRGNSLMLVGYSNIDEKDVYQFMNTDFRMTPKVYK